ncbi:hypothetical protein HRF87_00910 [Bacillus sp. CRN 9]|nr:hypothetical protein [Bacillus sp. CRN 9]
MKKYEGLIVLLILGYFLFFQERLPVGILTNVLNGALIVLMILMIIDLSLSLFHRLRKKGD